MFLHALDVEDFAAQGQDGLVAAFARLLGRATCGVTLDDVELGERWVAHGAIGELAGESGAFERTLAAREVAGLAGGGAGFASLDGLLHDHLRRLGVLVKIFGETLVDGADDKTAHLGIAELGLGLAFELRLVQAYGDDGGKALATILAGEVLIFLLEEILLASIFVNGLGQCRAEALEMRATVGGVDVVGERANVLGVGLGPLHGNLDLTGLAFRLEIHGLVVDDGLALVHVPDEVDNAALVLEDFGLGLLAAGIAEDDLEALVEEGRLAEVDAQRLVIELDGLENLRIGPESDNRAGFLGLANLGNLLNGLAARKLHLPDGTVALDLRDDLGGQGIDDGNTDAMQAAGNLVAAAAKLAAGVEDGENDLKRRHVLALGVLLDGDAAAVVDDGAGSVLIEGYVNLVAKAGKRLIDGVIDNLVDEVMQALGARRTDVHAGALADMLQTFENLDVLCAVAGFLLSHHSPNTTGSAPYGTLPPLS